MSLGEAILGAFLAGLLTALTSHDFINFARREGILKKLEQWKKTLLMIQQLINDAQEKQLTDGAVKIWLDDIRDLAYDVDDMLDEFATESLRRKVLATGDQQASTSKVQNLMSSTRFSFSRFRGSNVWFNRKMRSRINEVDRRLKMISKRRFELGLEKIVGSGRMRPGNVWQKPPSGCVPSESDICGRDDDKKRIIDLLLREEVTDDANFLIVPIVGMGGIGKTTLAQHVYHHDAVMGNFHLKAWVCVSDDFDVTRIAKAILESITHHPCDLKEYSDVQVKLKEELAGKKFLLVLDDVWNKNYGLWEALKPPFLAGASGSKIIVTTREVNVAKLIGTSKFYNLKPLSDDECWSVFAKHAFENIDSSMRPNLQPIRQKIVRKCGGLPLAARTLGGLLRSKQRDDEWEDILNSKIWDLPDSESDILPVLRLSYYHLPSHLKRCFAYCAILPKDFEFDESDLVLLWMAEGLVQGTKGHKQMEDLGGDYFHDLVSRSIFQQSSSNKSRFVMHDLVNDLAQWAAGETCFKLDGEIEGNERTRICKRARHSSFVRDYYDGIKKFEIFHTTNCLRTFLPLPLTGDQGCWLTNHVIFELLPKLRYLRVLSLSSYNLNSLPDSVGELKHLRFLNISHTRLTSLPESISSLYNLQTLLLTNCGNLKGLPSKIENLINLRHLDITNATSIKEMPLGIGLLKNLRTLSNFFLGEDGGSRITALMNLRSLQGTLCISGLENVTNAQDAREANINNKRNIDILILEWNFKFDNVRDGRIEMDVLDNFRPHGRLKELIIKCYVGPRFPTWVGNPSFSRMAHVRLENCLKCTILPSLGLLPSLKILSIVNLIAVEKVGPEFCGDGCLNPFPVLESLQFEKMLKWEEWIPAGDGYEDFPSLRELSISGCPKLSKKLPNKLPSLEKLVIDKCMELSVSINSLPKLCKLEVKGCKEVVHDGDIDLNSLNSMLISDVRNVTCLTNRFTRPFAQLKELEIANCKELSSLYHSGETLPKHLSSLYNLVIHGCPQFTSLVAEEHQEEEEQLHHQLASCKLGSLTLRFCENLDRLPKWFYSIISLKELSIQECPKLLSFPASGLPCMLREIRILNCNALSSLPIAVTENCTFLEYLAIQGCDSLIFFKRNHLPPTLKKLEIKACRNLVCLLEDEEGSLSIMPGDNACSSSRGASLLEYLFVEACDSLVSVASRGQFPETLKHLQIHLCPNLTYLPSGDRLPAGLKRLTIHTCKKLKSVVEKFQKNSSVKDISLWFCNNLKCLPKGLHELSNLREISLSYCSSVVSFSEGGLPANLRRLIIIECEKLQAMPDRMYNLTSLQEMRIRYCPNILSFPEEGFPTSLTSLWITDLKICKLLFDWGLHKLTSLRSLYIQGGCTEVVSFPLEDTGMMLPATLTRLRIRDFPNLEYLSEKGFQNLSSLQELWISDCPKLASFPKSGLPLSVLELRVERCPLFRQQFLRGDMNEWLKIRHICYIKIDGKFASYPEF